MINIKILKTSQDVSSPTYATDGSAGLDLCAYLHAPITLAPGQAQIIPTGIKIALPYGYEAQVRSRSGLAAKYSVVVLNSPGTIDADFRGEIKVILINHGKENFIIENNMRIAQLVIAEYVKVSLVQVDELDETDRGEGGFGSTGL